jgi:hypothetical protein
MDWLGKQLGIKVMDDWYKVSSLDFEVHRGRELLQLYNFNPTNVIKTIYSEYNWKLWEFHRVPAKSYGDISVVKKFVNYAEDQLKIKKMEDW